MSAPVFARWPIAVAPVLTRWPLAAALACALVLGACRRERPGLQPRHLVLVTFDSLRADHLSCYAHSRPTSTLPSAPQERLEGRAFSLDDLAAGGVIFARAFAPSARTLPSLASLLTGRPPAETGVIDDRSRLPRDVPTLAELARAAGFHTAAFVSQPRLDVVSAVGRGFEVAHWCADDGAALAHARRWLERDFGDEGQVFLWIHLSGLEPPWDEITPEELEDPEMDPGRFLDPQYHGPADGSPEFFARLRSGSPEIPPADRAALAELYDGRIAGVAGRLTSFLRDAFDYHRRGAEVTEFWSRTLLVLTATHGFSLGERGGEPQAELQDEELAVPLILRHPDSLTGERVMLEIVELTDVVPTMIELFDLPRARDLRGRSLLGLTDSRPAQEFDEHSIITQVRQRVFSVRSPRWRLVWSPYRAKLAENDPYKRLPDLALYDHASGRAGTENVAQLYPDVVARLQEDVKAWIKTVRFRPSLPLTSEATPETRPR